MASASASSARRSALDLVALILHLEVLGDRPLHMLAQKRTVIQQSPGYFALAVTIRRERGRHRGR
jgi:hypothetical protein